MSRPGTARSGRAHRIVDSIKFRVVLAASLLFTLIMMSASLVLVQSWSDGLEQRRPSELPRALDAICTQVATDGDPASVSTTSEAPVRFEVLSPSGTSSGGFLLTGGQSLSTPAPEACSGPGSWQLSRSSTDMDGDVQISLSRTVPLSDGTWNLTVSTTTGAVPDDVALMVRTARLVIPTLVAVVALLLWLVTAQALRPVHSIIRASEEISLGTLDQRLPAPTHDDEIAELVVHLNSMFDRLEDANRRQQQFVSDASHELRSPVSTILAVSERKGLGESDLSLIHTEASRLSGLIDSLLELARVQEGAEPRREEFSLTELLLEDAERVLVPAERRGVTVDTSDVHDVMIRASRGAVTGVVRNLVDNAVRHATSEVALHCNYDGDDVVVEVHDDGPGIPPDQREAVFERFVRLDSGRARAVGGTGLGLALVRDLVVAHGGSASAQSSPLGGAAFVVVLPRDPDTAA